ncbi:hypothetical protein ACJBU6_08657 [Exserohilum turcicum]
MQADWRGPLRCGSAGITVSSSTHAADSLHTMSSTINTTRSPKAYQRRHAYARPPTLPSRSQADWAGNVQMTAFGRGGVTPSGQDAREHLSPRPRRPPFHA